MEYWVETPITPPFQYSGLQGWAVDYTLLREVQKELGIQ